MNTFKQVGQVNLLFLGGAKRVAIARMFKDAARRHGLECSITGYELDSRSALACEGHIVEGLRWSDRSARRHRPPGRKPQYRHNHTLCRQRR